MMTVVTLACYYFGIGPKGGLEVFVGSWGYKVGLEWAFVVFGLDNNKGPFG